MKLSLVLSTQPASFSALAYKGHIAESIGKIKKMGYDGVELAVRDPSLLEMDDLRAILSDNGLPVPAIGTGQAFGEEGLSFTDGNVSVRQKAIDRIKSQIALASEFQAVVIIGLIRGKYPDDVAREVADRWLVEALQECADENDSVKLVIEPVNRYESDIINTLQQARDMLKKIDRKNIGLLPDTFHMNIEESSFEASVSSAGDQILHFHVADSNRWYPGAGHIDFSAICTTLEHIAYSGYLSAEILPLPDPDTAARLTVKHMRDILD